MAIKDSPPLGDKLSVGVVARTGGAALGPGLAGTDEMDEADVVLKVEVRRRVLVVG